MSLIRNLQVEILLYFTLNEFTTRRTKKCMFYQNLQPVIHDVVGAWQLVVSPSHGAPPAAIELALTVELKKIFQKIKKQDNQIFL